MQRLHRPGLIYLVVALTLAGCVSAAGAPGAAQPSPGSPLSTIALPTGPAMPIPEVAFSEVVVRPGAESGAWIVLGMAHNRSASALGSVTVRVELLDASGAVLGETTAPLPLSVLQPGALCPFQAAIVLGAAPAAARADLEAFVTSSDAAAEVGAGKIYSTRAPEGMFARGSVRNAGTRPARVREVVIAWRGGSRSLAGVVLAAVPGVIVPEGESLPWMAQAPGATPGTRFEVYVASSSVDAPLESPLILSGAPSWKVTGQGKRFVVGEIRSTSDVPVLPQISVAVRNGDEPISLEILPAQIPLPPGETLIFTADDFPGLQAAVGAAGLEADDMGLDVYLDAAPVPAGASAPIRLPVSIVQFEAIGSSLFVQGTVSNPDAVPLERAVVFLGLRSTAGEPLSSRWLDLEVLPGETPAEFSIDLPLAAGIDPAMGEYDVRAFGLPFPGSS